MSLLVGLILTALNGPVGTENRGVAVANLDTVSLNLFKITFEYWGNMLTIMNVF
jgi:hypothetical protein